ncbi:aquaporin [Novosphingobium sp.]|uniref:aquaporin n=1 Tax=Novosphingobium sp. TaxID=1874826 RepID=UPI003BA85AFC
MTGAPPACFHEADPGIALARRAAAEGAGTLLLAFAASAGGIAATRLLPGQPGAAALFVALAVAGALVALIVALGTLSGGHFNPLISFAQLLSGERTLPCAAAYIACQLAGGVAGGALGAALWHAAPAGAGGLGPAGMASEFVASAGLMLIVLGSARSGRPETGPFAVGAWLVAAIIATPTGSYANPAVVVGAVVAAGPVALGAGSAPPYIAAEIAGTLFALAIIAGLFPKKEPIA